MMPDNSKALVITKKMNFKLEHLNNGVVKGILNIKEETFDKKIITNINKKETVGWLMRSI